jgi:hypothetical protein
MAADSCEDDAINHEKAGQSSRAIANGFEVKNEIVA